MVFVSDCGCVKMDDSGKNGGEGGGGGGGIVVCVGYCRLGSKRDKKSELMPVV